MATTKGIVSSHGDSLVLTVPPEVAKELGLIPGATVDMDVVENKLVLKKHRYTFDELLDQCDPNAPMSDEDKEWLNSPPVGRELI